MIVGSQSLSSYPMADDAAPQLTPKENLKEPSKQTLKKYGLSIEAWRVMAEEQGYACFVCLQVPKKQRLCIDHFHVKGWRKLPPEERVKYVRALLCWTCNAHYLFRGITIAKSKRVTELLERFETRKPK